MKVLYLLQTHKNPSQIKRLVSTLKKSSPESQVLISHNWNYSNLLTSQDFQDFSGVDIIYNPGGRGNFSLVQAYLNSLEFLFNKKIQFDWIVNLSGQDYPTHPLPVFEQFLSQTTYAGFLEYRDLLSENSYYGLRESQERYFYQYWHSEFHLSRWQRALLKPIRMVTNNTQSLVRIGTTYQFSVGIRSGKLFNTSFKCYGGSFFKILSHKCAAYLYETVKKSVGLVEYYQKSIAPEESLIQTILANSHLFNLCDKNYFYIDWTGTKHGHPKILTVADYSKMTKGEEYYFARKFDPAIDSEILDRLDEYIFSQSGLKIG